MCDSAPRECAPQASAFPALIFTGLAVWGAGAAALYVIEQAVIWLLAATLTGFALAGVFLVWRVRVLTRPARLDELHPGLRAQILTTGRTWTPVQHRTRRALPAPTRDAIPAPAPRIVAGTVVADTRKARR